METLTKLLQGNIDFAFKFNGLLAAILMFGPNNPYCLLSNKNYKNEKLFHVLLMHFLNFMLAMFCVNLNLANGMRII